MGKKITLDFSKVEERSGWNSKEMPEGLHEFKIELVDLKDAADGTAMWTYGLRPTNPKYKTRLFPYYCKHQQNQLFKLRDLFTAVGIPVPKKRTGLDPDAPVGKIIAAEVSDSSNANYQGRSEIDGVYDRSIIDDEDQVDDGEEVDDEDDEADEVEDDEEYDEEGEEEVDDEALSEEELREEIEGLTLGELRKRAKGLGIDHDGVKKVDLIELVIEEELAGEDEEESDEEDDLDDEELEDEDLEDEEFDDEEDEEEEPPAKPVRRAAAKPAAKATAKAEPAKRRVIRR